MKINNHKIYLSQGCFEGRRTWHYVKVDALKQPLFKQAIKSGTIDVANYGEVLFSGWGEKPPEDIVQHIQKKYG